ADEVCTSGFPSLIISSSSSHNNSLRCLKAWPHASHFVTALRFNMTRPLNLVSLSLGFVLGDAFHFERSATDMQVALGIWNLNTGSGEMLVDQVIQIASEPARAVTHFTAPGNELEINGAIAKFFQKRGRLRMLERS